MRTNEKKEPVLIYDKSGQQKQNQTAPAPDATTQTGAAPATDAATQTSAAPVATTPAAPQADPFADYMKESQRQYASTIADIRRRRQELEAKYQPNIERQKKIMKIMALGKLIGQLGQLAGGGAGTPVVDKDPYQINAWNELNRMRNEQRYYGQQLDAEERAVMNNMRTGLNRLQYEQARQKAANQYKIAEMQERTRQAKEVEEQKQKGRMELKELDIQAKKDLENTRNKNRLMQIAQQYLYRIEAYGAKYGFDSDLIYQRGLWQEYLGNVTNAKTDKDGNIIISSKTYNGQRPSNRGKAPAGGGYIKPYTASQGNNKAKPRSVIK